MVNKLMNSDTSNRNICTKEIEYVRYNETTANTPTARTFTILVNKRTQMQQEMIAINKKLAGEPEFPCQCPNCRTTAT